MSKAYPGQIRIIGGKFRGRKIPVMSMASLRPTPDRVRETLFNWLQPTLFNAHCLDLFAGTGILGFEALSRGAQQSTFVEMDAGVVALLKKTREELKLSPEQCRIFHQDAKGWLQTNQALLKSADVIFLDPPFHSTLLEDCLALLPKASELKAQVKLYIEAPTDKPVPTIEGFALHREKKAGMVAYYLFIKTGNDS